MHGVVPLNTRDLRSVSNIALIGLAAAPDLTGRRLAT